MAWRPAPPSLIALFDAVLPADSSIERRRMFGYPAAFVGGRLFAVVGDSPAMQATLYTRADATHWTVQSLFENAAVRESGQRIPVRHIPDDPVVGRERCDRLPASFLEFEEEKHAGQREEIGNGEVNDAVFRTGNEKKCSRKPDAVQGEEKEKRMSSP